LRRVVDAIFYLLQAGCQWRMLPKDFPPRSTVYGYFRAWIVAGMQRVDQDATGATIRMRAMRRCRIAGRA
jgi:transposase